MFHLKIYFRRVAYDLVKNYNVPRYQESATAGVVAFCSHVAGDYLIDLQLKLGTDST